MTTQIKTLPLMVAVPIPAVGPHPRLGAGTPEGNPSASSGAVVSAAEWLTNVGSNEKSSATESAEKIFFTVLPSIFLFHW